MFKEQEQSSIETSSRPPSIGSQHNPTTTTAQFIRADIHTGRKRFTVHFIKMDVAFQFARDMDLSSAPKMCRACE
jgi:hypothetical protein